LVNYFYIPNTLSDFSTAPSSFGNTQVIVFVMGGLGATGAVTGIILGIILTIVKMARKSHKSQEKRKSKRLFLFLL